ncbi:Ferredoxin [Nannocystis exedens]|uniref:Ferredoxin n=1 Tax=Nannocystis exedens TaxID=54 RepID=A0A1I2D2D6_9BACT|nr:ferredoxin [Nannocystis exedens]PCC68703.1 ferredoxin [Nannocystis exedens]SFE74130.1 Ferredoxin [Nannocystis exedens]
MRIIIDENKCCGAGQCVLIAPRVFDQRDDGIVILLDEAPPKELHAAVREAACVCPGAAIALEERP